MYTPVRTFVRRVGVARLAVVLIAVIGMTAPRLGRPKSPLSTKAVPAVVATLRPARPRRKVQAPRPDRPLPAAMDDNTQATVTAIRKIARAVRLAGHEAQKRLGMTSAQLAVLRALNDPQPLCINDLAERTMTNPSSVSEVVARLVSQGLVCRTRSARDGRSVELTLSDSGRSIVASALGPDDRLRNCVEQLPSRQRRQLSRLLGRLLEKIRGADSVSAPTCPQQVAEAAEPLSDAPPDLPTS